jgi:hypothetical protein
MRAESTNISWALACRTRSFIRIAGIGTQLDQVSGASDRVVDVVTCSDRTMVALELSISLAALANSTAPLTHQRTLTRMGTSQTSPGKQNYGGLDLEKTSRFRLWAKFFLDIPFNRTH